MRDPRTGLDPESPEDNVKMMRCPDLWPHGNGMLPLIRRSGTAAPVGGKELGMLVSRPGVPPTTVFFTSMFDRRLLGNEAIKTVRHKEYRTHEDIVRDGWLVD